MQDLDFNGQLVKALKISGLLMLLLILVLVSRPGDHIVWGLVVGIATGMWSAFFLAKRLNFTEKADINKARMQIHIGLGLRLLLIMAVLFVVAWTGWVSIFATAAGIFVPHVVFIIVVIWCKRAGGRALFNNNQK
ncbi:MAG: ATP synthase subunit I [Desulfotomaculaceae bacterium]|nr:ATP synthase subunit I [Desulfotomaculaceae bacterium]